MITADQVLLTAEHKFFFHVYAADMRPTFAWKLPDGASRDLAGMPRAELRRIIKYKRRGRRRI